LGLIFFLAMIVGFVKGLIDDRPSIWRGFGEGLAGRGKLRGGTNLFFQNRLSGSGIRTFIDGARHSLMIAGHANSNAVWLLREPRGRQPRSKYQEKSRHIP
jgi:hypothetical protein